MADWDSKGRVITQILGNVFQTLGQDFGSIEYLESSTESFKGSATYNRLG